MLFASESGWAAYRQLGKSLLIFLVTFKGARGRLAYIYKKKLSKLLRLSETYVQLISIIFF